MFSNTEDLASVIKRKSDAKRVISIILVVLSIILLFLPWLTPTSSLKNTINTINTQGISTRDIEKMTEEFEEEGINVDVGSFIEDVLDLRKGISPESYKTWAHYSFSICNTMEKEFNGLGMLGNLVNNSDIKNSLKSAKVGAVLYIVLFYLTVIMAAICLVLRIIDKKTPLDIFYFVLMLILVVWMFFSCRVINSISNEQFQLHMNVFNLSLTPFLSLICAVPYSLYSKLIFKNKTPEPVSPETLWHDGELQDTPTPKPTPPVEVEKNDDWFKPGGDL